MLILFRVTFISGWQGSEIDVQLPIYLMNEVVRQRMSLPSDHMIPVGNVLYIAPSGALAYNTAERMARARGEKLGVTVALSV